MALVHAVSFDHEQASGGSNGDEWLSSNGGPTATTHARTGKAIKYSAPIDQQSPWAAGYANLSNTIVNFLHAYVYIVTAPGAGAETFWIIQNGGTSVLKLGWDENLKPFFKDGAGTYARSTNALSANQGYWIAAWIDNTNGATVHKLWVLKLDGIDTGSYWINVAGTLRHESVNWNYYFLGPTQAKGTTVGEFYLDNFVWLNNSGARNNAILTAEHECFNVDVSGNSGSGTYQAMKKSSTFATPGDYTMWNANPAQPVTYNYSDADSVDKKQASVIPSAATLGITTAPIGLCVRSVRDMGNVAYGGTHKTLIYDGVTEAAVSDDSVSTPGAARNIPACFDTDPSAAAWTVAAIANLQIGNDALAALNGGGSPVKRIFYDVWGTFVCPRPVASTGVRRRGGVA